MKRKFKIVIISILIILSVVILVAIVSPRPATYAIQKLFEGGLAVKPENYEEILDTVVIKENLTYESKWKNNTFDLITPKKTQEKIPIIFWMHGGAYVAGDKSDVSEYAVQIASQGYALVNLNYELAPQATYPTPLIQLGEAYQYIVEKYQDYNFDFDQIYFAGDSAGAQIVAQFVNIQVNDAYQKEVKLPATLSKEKIAGVLLFCGPYDFEHFERSSMSKYLQFFIHRVGWSYFGSSDWKESDALKHSSIINYIDETFPKTFITDANTFSFEEQAKKLVTLFNELGVENTSVFYDVDDVTLEHEYQFKMDNEYSINTMNELLEFLKSE
ncbi:alpha/beta hydrolase [Erysipelothrix urinaevulpis]|uniref:alpha/beta hydrolase n=1 Tax=Erysipelothrix urinaevulpis TaxID=2683717 RepID=UPI0013592431|nr:alpha/beta hydrolase [Erysipelothrix urinaevulpis]